MNAYRFHKVKLTSHLQNTAKSTFTYEFRFIKKKMDNRKQRNNPKCYDCFIIKKTNIYADGSQAKQK